MAKHQVTIEFEVPDDVSDLCWKGEKAGFQVAHDVLITSALAYLTSFYADTLKSKDQGFTDYAQLKLDIFHSVNLISSKQIS
jgi:hypothetical protein